MTGPHPSPSYLQRRDPGRKVQETKDRERGKKVGRTKKHERTEGLKVPENGGTISGLIGIGIAFLLPKSPPSPDELCTEHTVRPSTVGSGKIKVDLYQKGSGVTRDRHRCP